ncbi:glucose 1-dehydrogenase [Gloeocapsopsis dulcis]|uniref:Ketoreductase domain-containing protein n=1 Tax=Gloeocapsopsis dulcis AAB1 = 1H9 TaxID=1433147 RepID=A0A6N8FV31_9CHRO|nr:glucose 1-dehydrogenase [Gloeocapsopsis dulcis]MUL36634.1 hypothetical protein [Gloeocapsopsis dulcis AAB1 = 1H9]WNN87259.1 glucose 1-dehydrogenase [Gloeocapsopsis dulcis]
MTELNGKVALVTGASRGIGAATAKHLAAAGAKVAVNYVKNADAAYQVVQAIEQVGGVAIAIAADVADPTQVKQLFTTVTEQFGTLHILVNNAGTAESAPLSQIDDGHIERQFDLNVRGLIYACQEASRWFEGEGRIINLSSVVADGVPGGAVYAATKAAVNAITRSLAIELGDRQIAVNAVSPGPVDTDLAQTVNTAKSFQQMVSRTPLGRLGVPDDIARAIAFLAPDDAAWITGQIIGTDGGFRF